MIDEVISVDAGPAIAGLQEFAAEAKAAAAEFKAAFGDLSIGGAAGGGPAAKLAASMDEAAASIKGAAGEINAAMAKLGGAGDAAAAGLERVGEAADAAAGGLKDASASADEAAAAQDRLAESAGAAGAAMDRQAVAAGRAAKSSAESAAAGEGFFSRHKTAILGTGLALGYAVDKAMKFNGEMTLLNTQAGVSTKQMPQLTKGVLELAGQVGQSPGNLAESLFHVESNMSSLGIKAPQALNLVKTAAEGASVGHANLVDVTNALTSVVASGIPGVKNYSAAMGVLNATVGSGDMSMQQLADSMASGVVPIVKGYGLNIKDVGAALATFGDLNIRGAQAGTDLRTSVQALAVPAKAGAAELKALGLSQNSLAHDMQSGGLLKALDDLTGRMKAHGITAKNMGGVITDLFGKKAGPGLAVLLENMDRLNSKYPELTRNAKDFGQAWDKTLQTPQQRLNNLVAGTQALAITAGNVLLPYVNKGLGAVDTGLGWLQQHSLANKGLALGAGALVVGGISKGLFSGVESALQGFGKLGSVLKIPGMDKLANIGGGGLTGAAADLTGAAGRLSAAAAELGGSAGKLDTASAAEGRAGAGGGKGGSVLGAATLAAGGAWLLGHVIGSFLPKSTSAEQQQYQKNIPGWLQAPTNFVFGNKAASLYNVLPSAHDLWHDAFGGGAAPKPRPAPPPLTFPDGQPFYGEVPRGLPHPANFRASIPAGLPAPIPTYASGQPFYGEVPRGVAKPLPAVQSQGPTLQGIAAHAGAQLAIPAPKPIKIPPPDTSAVSAVKAKLTADVSNIPVKPIKMPSPDMSALDSAKGKAQSAGNAITSAITGALGKTVKAKSPDLTAYQAAAGPARADGNAISAGLASGILAGEGAAVAAAHQVAAAVTAALNVSLQVHSPSRVTYRTGTEFSAGLEHGITAGNAKAKAAAAGLSASAVLSLTQGLQGGKSALDAAMQAITGKGSRPQDITMIDQTVAKLLTHVPAGDSALVKMLKADNKDLDNMARQRARIEQEISDSEQVAKSAISGASIMNSLTAANPAGNEPIASSAIITGQGYQASSLKQFAAALKKDQALGLNATSLSQIAQAGPDQGLGIAQGIASGGKGAVTQLNAIQKQIQASSAAIGNVAGPAMYQAGQDVGKGLAAGLKSELGSLDKAMEQLAKSMVASVQSHTKKAKTAAKKAASGTVSDATSPAAASPGAPAAETAAAGGKSLGTAAASLSGAAASLSGSATALSAAAAALNKAAAGGGSAPGHPKSSPAHPVATGGGYPVRSGTPVRAGAGYSGGGSGVTIINHHTTVNVAGSVTSERGLLDSMQNRQLTRSNNNWQNTLNLPGKPR